MVEARSWSCEWVLLQIYDHRQWCIRRRLSFEMGRRCAFARVLVVIEAASFRCSILALILVTHASCARHLAIAGQVSAIMLSVSKSRACRRWALQTVCHDHGSLTICVSVSCKAYKQHAIAADLGDDQLARHLELAISCAILMCRHSLRALYDSALRDSDVPSS